MANLDQPAQGSRGHGVHQNGAREHGGHDHAGHDHGGQEPPRRVEALAPTLSLLRLSAVQRLFAAGALIAVIWAAVAAILG